MHRRVKRIIAYVGWTLGIMATWGGCREAVDRQAQKPAATGAKRTGDDSCPYKTPEQWRSFLAKAADDPRWVETCEDSACNAEYYRTVHGNLQAVFEKYGNSIQRDPAIAIGTEHFRLFVPAWMRQHDDHSYGFNADNRAYLAAQEAADKPQGMMRPPQPLIAAIPDRQGVEAAARRNGWKYLIHDSAISGARIFVVVPDPRGRFDQWLVFNLVENGQSVTTTMPLSVLAVQKQEADGRPLAMVRLHFRDYGIRKDKHGGFKIELFEASNGKCYGCHPSGVRRLIPRRTPSTSAQPVRGETGYEARGNRGSGDVGYARLLEFNKRLQSYGLPDWQGTVDPAAHGPALGEEQGCTECHDGKTRGMLTVSTSISQLKRKVLVELSMPPQPELAGLLERAETNNPPLSFAEREKLQEARDHQERLLNQLYRSRLPKLKNWLMEETGPVHGGEKGPN